jgi:hypothetical protein
MVKKQTMVHGHGKLVSLYFKLAIGPFGVEEV